MLHSFTITATLDGNKVETVWNADGTLTDATADIYNKLRGMQTELLDTMMTAQKEYQI